MLSLACANECFSVEREYSDEASALVYTFTEKKSAECFKVNLGANFAFTAQPQYANTAPRERGIGSGSASARRESLSCAFQKAPTATDSHKVTCTMPQSAQYKQQPYAWKLTWEKGEAVNPDAGDGGSQDVWPQNPVNGGDNQTPTPTPTPNPDDNQTPNPTRREDALEQSGEDAHLFKYSSIADFSKMYYIYAPLHDKDNKKKAYASKEKLAEVIPNLDESLITNTATHESLFQQNPNNNNKYFYKKSSHGECFDATTLELKYQLKINDVILLKQNDNMKLLCAASDNAAMWMVIDEKAFVYESHFTAPPPSDSFGSNAGEVFGLILAIFFGILLVLYILFVLVLSRRK